MPRRGYYGFDPQEFAAEEMSRNPYYNPLSPNADILGGIRGTLNMMWGLREAQRERTEEQRQQTWREQVSEKEQKVAEREVAAREKQIALAAQLSPAEIAERARWDYIDKLPITDRDKWALKNKEIGFSQIGTEVSKAGRDYAKKQMGWTDEQIEGLSIKDKGELNDVANEFIIKSIQSTPGKENEYRNRVLTWVSSALSGINSDYNAMGERINTAVAKGGISDQQFVMLQPGKDKNPITNKLLEGSLKDPAMQFPNPKYTGWKDATDKHKELWDIRQQLVEIQNWLIQGWVPSPQEMDAITNLINRVTAKAPTATPSKIGGGKTVIVPPEMGGNLPEEDAKTAAKYGLNSTQAQAEYEEFLKQKGKK